MSWFDDTPERRLLLAEEKRRLDREEAFAHWTRITQVKTEYRRRRRNRRRSR